MKPDSKASSWADTASLPGNNLFAAVDLMLAACQRSVVLQATLLDDMARQSLAHSRELSKGGTPSPDWPRALFQEGLMEPSLRYVTGMMALGRTTSSCLMSLGTAQLRGSDDEVASLSRGAHDDAVDAAQDAAAATASALSHCLEAIGKMGEMAARAGVAAVANGAAQLEQVREQQTAYVRDGALHDEEEDALDRADAEEMTEPISPSGRHVRMARAAPRGRGH